MHFSEAYLSEPQSVFNRLAGVIVPLLCELESSEKWVEVNSVGPWESLTVEKPENKKITVMLTLVSIKLFRHSLCHMATLTGVGVFGHSKI